MKKSVIIVILIIVLLVAGGVTFFVISNKDKEDDKDNKSSSEKMDEEENIDNENSTYEESDYDDVENTSDDEESDNVANALHNQAIDAFNARFESYGGTKTSSDVRALIQNVISNNEENKEKEVILEMDGEEYSSESELKSIRSEIDKDKNYTVSFEYNDDGYVDKVIIK